MGHPRTPRPLRDYRVRLKFDQADAKVTTYFTARVVAVDAWTAIRKAEREASEHPDLAGLARDRVSASVRLLGRGWGG